MIHVEPKSPLLDCAHEYFQLGLNVIPLAPLSKQPAGNWGRWKVRQQTQANIDWLFAKHTGNIAVLGGIHSNIATAYPYFVDCDNMGAFLELSAECLRLFGDTTRTLSKRGGHIWLASTLPVKSHKLVGIGEIRGAGNYIAVPPSIHPDTHRPYEFASRVASLPLANSLTFTKLELLPEVKTVRLSRLAYSIIAGDPDTIKRYSTRSEVDHALMQSLVNKAYGMQDIIGIFNKSAHEPHVHRTDTNWLSYLRAEYEKCRQRGNSNEFEQAQQTTRTYRLWVESTPSHEITHPRTGVTDKTALLAHISTAERVGRIEYQLSARDGANLARMGRSTFNKATGRLVESGLIRQTRQGIFTLANRFTLVPHRLSEDIVRTLTHRTPHVCECPHYVQHAVFEQRGLGRHLGDTFAALSERLMTATELAEVTGKHPRTIRRHLAQLLKFSLIVCDGDLVTADARRLDELAQRLETTDIAERRNVQFRRERLTYRNQMNRMTRPLRGGASV